MSLGGTDTERKKASSPRLLHYSLSATVRHLAIIYLHFSAQRLSQQTGPQAAENIWE